jgi:hypothetical protein
MAAELQNAYSPVAFRWKLFLMVVLVMGLITAGAIILTLRAHPPAGDLHIPTLKPMATLASQSSRFEA